MKDGEDPNGGLDPALFEAVFEDSSIGIALIEVGGDGRPERVLKVNPALVEITGFPEEELLGSGPSILGLESRSREAESVRSTGSTPSRVEFEHSFERPDRSRMWVMVTLSPIETETAEDGRYRLAQIQDISERRNYQSRLRFLAEHDPLTGLVNPRRLYETVDKALAFLNRYGGNAALISFDLDRFKTVNDAWGHAAGDDLLRRFALLLVDWVRESDTVARLGGDEFAVFLPGTDQEGAVDFAEGLLDHLRRNPIELDLDGIEEITISTSCGVTEVGGRNEVSARDLLAEADSALYAAKAAGRDCVIRYEAAGGASATQGARLTWAQRTRRALDQGNLFLEAQPIRDVATGELLRYEALLRMDDPDAGVVYPPTFLYTAERFGLSGELDSWVVGSVIEALADSPDQTTSLSVNLTAASFDPSSDLFDRLPGMLESAGVDPGRLEFELTEGTCLADIERARGFFEDAHRLGCRVALDDFGAGFGGFYYIKALPIDSLKIAGEFVRSVNSSREDRLIVKAVSDLARGLGIEVVAEFVTDEETAATCGDLGVTAVQGSFAGPTVALGEALGTR